MGWRWPVFRLLAATCGGPDGQCRLVYVPPAHCAPGTMSRAPFFYQIQKRMRLLFCFALICVCVLAMPKIQPCRSRPALKGFRPRWCAACQI